MRSRAGVGGCHEVGYIRVRPRRRIAVLLADKVPLRATCLIVRSNKSFSIWPEISAMPPPARHVDRLVHHADALVLQGESYRLEEPHQGHDAGEVTLIARSS